MYQPQNNILAWQEERSQGLRSLKAYGAYAVPLGLAVSRSTGVSPGRRMTAWGWPPSPSSRARSR